MDSRTDWLTKEYIYRFGELFKWAKNITHKQNSTLSCISTSVFVPAFTDAWVRLLLVHVNLHFLTVLKTNGTTWDTVTEKITTKGKMKLLNNNLAFLHSVLHLNLQENKQFSWITNDKQWTRPHSLRGGSVQQVWFGASHHKKTKQRIYCIDCVCSSFSTKHTKQ